ncbi:LETM1 and EF-hand domain-containing protein anon-60Da [Tropilaelaps mercedesae]|uniref:LETM1 and EF-hand domain-containing protein anon-60Da n=1 Tax=Tropilaelaps mercedesae TaxID=418985 RepID=A0A1V9XI44_9ACAR|nr:LETM1 and EF-hand domain-containing protein anon-60Da [Tropilaelaps mercedesae]
MASSTSSQKSSAMVFSPPQRKESRPSPSEFLLLKPFSRAPTLQMEIPHPGACQATLLSIQNIDNTSSRIYFEIPSGKPLTIRPDTIVIGPQSIELFEVIAMEPKESFRATVKVFAPDIKFYRAGQVNVSVTVKHSTMKIEKKKRPKVTGPIIKPKAVTVPTEFKFQPSREERKKATLNAGLTALNDDKATNSRGMSTLEVPPVLRPIDQTFNLDDIRRQTNLIKTVMDANQTYLIPPKAAYADPRDPVSFIRQVMTNDDCNLRTATLKYLDFAKARGANVNPPTQEQRKTMNSMLQQLLPAIQDGRLTFVLQQLSQIQQMDSKEQIELRAETLEDGGDKENTRPLAAQILQVRGMDRRSRRSSNLTTSSPKRNQSADITSLGVTHTVDLDTPERLSGMSQRTVGEMVSNYLPDGISPLDLITVASPDVSVIYPLSGESNGPRSTPSE